MKFLDELVKRAEKVNSKNSSKKDFMKYMDLKSQLFFREGVYKYREKMEKESSFKEKPWFVIHKFGGRH